MNTDTACCGEQTKGIKWYGHRPANLKNSMSVYSVIGCPHSLGEFYICKAKFLGDKMYGDILLSL